MIVDFNDDMHDCDIGQRRYLVIINQIQEADI